MVSFSWHPSISGRGSSGRPVFEIRHSRRAQTQLPGSVAFQHFHRSDESVSGFARSSPSRHNAHPRPENASPVEDALDDGVNFIGNALDFSGFDRHAVDFFCCDQKPLARPTATRRYHSSFGNGLLSNRLSADSVCLLWLSLRLLDAAPDPATFAVFFLGRLSSVRSENRANFRENRVRRSRPYHSPEWN